MNKYLQEAKRFYEEALREFARVKEGKNEVKARDACAKVWLAVMKATEALFVNEGVEESQLPKSYRGVRYFLYKCGDKDLRRLFHTARDVFHIDGYYEGIINFDEMPEYLDEVKEYMVKVEAR